MTQVAMYPLRLPQSLKAAVTKAAKRDGGSINRFITMAVAERIAALDTGQFFEQRRTRADMTRFR